MHVRTYGTNDTHWYCLWHGSTNDLDIDRGTNGETLHAPSNWNTAKLYPRNFESFSVGVKRNFPPSTRKSHAYGAIGVKWCLSSSQHRAPNEQAPTPLPPTPDLTIIHQHASYFQVSAQQYIWSAALHIWTMNVYLPSCVLHALYCLYFRCRCIHPVRSEFLRGTSISFATGSCIFVYTACRGTSARPVFWRHFLQLRREALRAGAWCLPVVARCCSQVPAPRR